MGHVAAGLALQDSLGEEGDAAGPEISFGLVGVDALDSGT